MILTINGILYPFTAQEKAAKDAAGAVKAITEERRVHYGNDK